MANTNFSGPVISAGGFTGNVTGNLIGQILGKVETRNSDGSLSISHLLSIVGPDGTDGSAATAFTLPNGADGQLKIIKYQDGTVTTDAVVTPANLAGYATLTFDAKTEYAILVSDGSSWHPIVSTAALG